jgi:hypothetical protein
MKDIIPAEKAAPKLTLVKHDRYLEGCVGTTQSLASLKTQLLELAALCGERRAGLVLIDVTRYSGTLSTLDRYEIGMIGQKFGTHVRRVACLANPEVIDPQKFAVKVARNRGLEVDIFSERSEAEAWLLEA